MSSTLVLVALAAVVFFVLVFFIVNAVGTRLTGKQIEEDPDVHNHVEPDKRGDDFPVDAEF